MAQDFNDVKMAIRSVLTSAPGKVVTISDILKDYKNLEGDTIPYKQLGFNSVFELFESMNDVLKVSAL